MTLAIVISPLGWVGLGFAGLVAIFVLIALFRKKEFTPPPRIT